MTTRFFSLLLLLASSNLFAQNLVPNHSFEEFVDGCPSTFNGTVALGWERWAQSPDLFSTCVDPQNFSDSLGWVPWNGLGYQWPADGESYAGLFAHGQVGATENFREYLGCQLLEPLELGETYYVSFKISSAEFGHYYWITTACNRMGAYFTTQDYHWQQNPLSIPNFAHIYEQNIVSDTENWVTISGSFVADQAYTHMGLGVFYDFDSLDVIVTHPHPLGGLGSYYFIDDVCVSRFPVCDVATYHDESLSTRNEVKMYPNPARDLVYVESSSTILSIGLQEFSGKWIRSEEPHGSNKISMDLSGIPSGIYILEIRTAKELERKKLVVVR
ncbi:MAG: T9SS C-terminal target domain-containing protein [Cryomorphaceae bacterium]|nr:MAG: T9SS C-terminal target domain-containing protein [Cryomorphaceae bacterium]